MLKCQNLGTSGEPLKLFLMNIGVSLSVKRANTLALLLMIVNYLFTKRKK